MFKNLKFNKNYTYLFLIIPLLTFFLFDYTDEADIWFLLKHGEYVLNNGFPKFDFLSMHEGLEFVMQQWLSSAIFYTIYNYLGKVAFYIFMFLINGVITYLIYKLCFVISGRKFASSFITLITMVLMQMFFIVPRPQVFTFIVLIFLLIILELYSSKKKKYIYFMPILSVLLVNFHASMWPMLFVFCMPYVAELLLKKDKDIFKLIFIMIVSGLCGFINPYGLGAMTYSLKSYGLDEICAIVGEMRSFNLIGETYVVYWSFLILIIFFISNLIIILKSSKNNIRVSHLLLFYGTFFMGLSAIRNVSLFIIGTIPFLVKYIEFNDINKFNLDKKWIINYSVVFIFIIILFSSAIITNKHIFVHNANEVALYLEKNEDKGITIFNDYSDGTIFEYYGFKPFIDARAEVFTLKTNNKNDYLTEYINFVLNKTSRDDFVKKYNFDYYSITAYYPDLANYLLNHKEYDFELVFANEHFYLIKRVG